MVATTTKICTKRCSIPTYDKDFYAANASAYTPYTWTSIGGTREVKRTIAPSIFRANLFGSWVVTHALEIDDFHAHLAAVLIKQHLLGFWMSPYYGTFLGRLTVYPTLSVLLTKTRPTKTSILNIAFLLEKGMLCWFKVWEGTESKKSRATNHWLYQTKLYIVQLSWGKFRRKPATRLFDGSFAAILNSDKRFARQHCYEILHQSFLWLRSIQV